MLIPVIPSEAVSGDFIAGMGEDVLELFSTEPLIVLGSGVPLTAAAMLLEDSCGHGGFMGDGLLQDCSVGCHYAFGPALLAAAGAVWGIGAFADSPDTEETGQMLTEGLLLSYGISGALKLGTGRLRPDGHDSRSFPSAHSAGTVCAAVIIWDRCGSGAGIPAAAMAAFTALSRIQLNRHYPSDVIAGCAIGAAAGLAVVNSRNDPGSEGDPVPALGISWSSSGGFGLYF